MSAFSWPSLADQTSSYPQTANVLLLVQVSTPAGLVWRGSWHSLQRTSSSQFFDIESSKDAELNQFDSRTSRGNLNRSEDTLSRPVAPRDGIAIFGSPGQVEAILADAVVVAHKLRVHGCTSGSFIAPANSQRPQDGVASLRDACGREAPA